LREKSSGSNIRPPMERFQRSVAIFDHVPTGRANEKLLRVGVNGLPPQIFEFPFRDAPPKIPTRRRMVNWHFK